MPPALGDLLIRPLVLAPLLLLPLAGPAAAQTPAPACRQVAAEPGPSIITAGQPWTLSARLVDGDTRETAWRVFRDRPTPDATVVRQATSTTSTAFTFALTRNHELRLNAAAPDGSCSYNVASYRIGVRPAVSLDARQNQARDYTFTGRVLPAAGQAVTLYRVEADGRRVVTSRTRVAPNGTYRIDRRFAGSGRFRFLATVGATESNLAGESGKRTTVIH